jgi:XTP/dITP diphosphohydrolase
VADEVPPSGRPLVEFIEVMRRLRAECPWKLEQTHRSLARHLLEETHETLEAIENGDPEHLREELGDLLLQVYFHSAIAAEAGEFTIDDVAIGLTEKMIRRNAHVFADASGLPSDLTPAQVNERWQQAKALEKNRTDLTEGIPPGLPALLYADKVLERLARLDTQPERRASVPAAGPEGELGGKLLDLVREARAAGVDPEQALRVAVRREISTVEG